jgi:hypothetical protein
MFDWIKKALHIGAPAQAHGPEKVDITPVVDAAQDLSQQSLVIGSNQSTLIRRETENGRTVICLRFEQNGLAREKQVVLTGDQAQDTKALDTASQEVFGRSYRDISTEHQRTFAGLDQSFAEARQRHAEMRAAFGETKLPTAPGGQQEDGKAKGC